MLYLVPTPIGNLKDITLRALEVLQSVDLILAEDTRTSGKLLKHYEIETPMRAFHMHNEHKSLEYFLNELKSGKHLALISDAGSPGISDPGYLLTKACADDGIEISALPGATALIPALAASGLPCDRFLFEGFLPHKKGRQKRIENLMEESRTMVFYESPHRIEKTLNQLSEAFGNDRQAVVAREISKKFETFHRGSLGELNSKAKEIARGEIVLMVAGK